MLPARFHGIRDRVLKVVDNKLAEPVRLSFLKSGIVDPDRAAIEIEAILRVGGGKETVPEGGTSNSWRTRIVAGRAELSIDQGKYPDIVARQGDKVKALARKGEPWFEVLAVDDRNVARLVLQLGEA